MERKCGSRSRYWDNKIVAMIGKKMNMVSWRFWEVTKSLGVARSGKYITQTIQSIQQAISRK
jgi:hypothetical protein